MAGTQRSAHLIDWSGDGLELRIDVGGDGMARLTRLSAAGAGEPLADAGLPLLDVVLAGEGRSWSGGRYCESEAGYRFRYAGHRSDRGDGGAWRELLVELDDPETGLRAEVYYRVLAGGGPGGALRSWVRLVNRGARLVTVESVTSFLYGGPGAGTGQDSLADLDLLWPENDSMAESRWQVRALRDALPDIGRKGLGADPRGCFGVTSTGTWSSGRYLPAGALVNGAPGRPGRGSSARSTRRTSGRSR